MFSSAGPRPATGTWQLFYQSNSSATGTQAAWQNVGQTFTFNANGELTPPVTSLTLQNLTVNGDSLGNVQMNFGSSGLTQFANSSGTAQVSQLAAERFAAGQLESIAVDSKNQITGTFSNGQTIPLARDHAGDVQRPGFAAGAQRRRLCADRRIPVRRSTARPASIVGSSLESSNVDISTQFSNLIVAQQAYSANARVMTTANQMIQSLLQVIQ